MESLTHKCEPEEASHGQREDPERRYRMKRLLIFSKNILFLVVSSFFIGHIGSGIASGFSGKDFWGPNRRGRWVSSGS